MSMTGLEPDISFEEPEQINSLFVSSFRTYIYKFKGFGKPAPGENFVTIISAGIISFIGIAAVGVFEALPNSLEPTDFKLLIGSFGATAVLLYGAIDSNLAQPWNCFVGHVISAFIGVCCHQIFEDYPDLDWLVAALSVSIAIVSMYLLRCIHPPGGASSLIAVIGSDRIHDLGFRYLAPVSSGAFLMIAVALLFNNLLHSKSYPRYWLPVSFD